MFQNYFDLRFCKDDWKSLIAIDSSSSDHNLNNNVRLFDPSKDTSSTVFEQALISLVESCEQEYAVRDVCHIKVLTISRLKD